VLQPILELSVDVSPQAVINMPLKRLIGSKSDIIKGHDDLDDFESASFKLNNGLQISVRHYRGHPKDTSTIYIDRKIKDIEEITRLVREILAEFRIPVSSIDWERKLDPDL
jgi:hypothetical protein